MNKQLKNTLERASQSYGEQITLRAAVKVIPHIGGALDKLLSGAGAKLRRKRLEHFLNELSSRLEKLESVPRIDENGLYDLVMDAIEQSVRTRKRSKRELFASVIARYVVRPSEADEIEMAIRIISELEEIHFEMLRLALEAPECAGVFSGLRIISIGEADEDVDFGGIMPLNVNEHMDRWPEETIPFAASELVSKALLFDEGSQRWDPKPLKYLVATDTARWVCALVVEQDYETTGSR